MGKCFDNLCICVLIVSSAFLYYLYIINILLYIFFIIFYIYWNENSIYIAGYISQKKKGKKGGIKSGRVEAKSLSSKKRKKNLRTQGFCFHHLHQKLYKDKAHKRSIMNTIETPNPKCSSCLCYWKPDEKDVKTSGLPFKTCRKCRAQNLNYKARNYERYHTRIDCACGGSYTRHNQARHILSKIHQGFIEKIEH